MLKKSLTIAMGMLIMTLTFGMTADAQIEKVTMHLDAFLCGDVGQAVNLDGIGIQSNLRR